MEYTVVFLIVCATVGMVEPHGYLKDPPARGTMWRQGWDTPQNYNDNQLFCGGKQHQHLTNGGKCGVCGDPYEKPQPRDNEGGGKYSSGVISKCYNTTSSFIQVKVQITANHLGYFEFRLCEHNDPFTPVTQECLDEHVLTLHNGGGIRYYIAPENGEYTVDLLMPEDIQCNQCVLQWKYNTGNSWGCEDGVCGLGYGDQEQFYGCSDISVLESCQNFDHYQYLKKPSTFSTTTISTPSTTTMPTPSTTMPTPSTTTIATSPTTTTSTTHVPSTTTSSTTKSTTQLTPISTNSTNSTTASTAQITSVKTTSTPSTLTTTSSFFGKCYPKPEFEVEKDAFDEICNLGCSKGLCLSYYCECEKQQSTTKSSTLMTILSSSPSSSSSSSSFSSTTTSSTTTLPSTTTRSSQKCEDVKVTDLYQGVAGMLDWCVQQCLIDICPGSHCIC